MKIEKRPKKSASASKMVHTPIAEANTIEVRRLTDSPNGFPYAVLRGAQVMGWLHTEADASRLAWSMQLIDLLKEELGRALLDRVFWHLRDIREK